MDKEKYYFLKNENLPAKGWLQSCIGCNAITGKTVLFKHADNINYNMFICYLCKRKNLHTNQEFIKKIENRLTPQELD